MPAQYFYQHALGSNVDISARVRAYRTEATSNAEEGSVATSTFYVDDEDAGLDIKGHRTWTWRESSEGSNSRTIYLGYTADRDVTRGPFRVTHARQWAVNTTDINTIMGRRIMRGSDANRPAETDVARIQWLMTTSEFGNGVTDSTYISTSSPVAMDAVDYGNQRCTDILDDCAQASGKNYFLILNEIPYPPTWALFYDFAHSTAYSSAVRLTNVLADVDSTTTFAVFNDDLKLNRDPSRVYSGVIVAYDGGDQYVEDGSIASEFARRDVISPSWNVKTAAKARARGLRYLGDIDTEEDRLTMSYLVPLASVNQLMQGHTYQVKFSHLPGYTNWTWVRALKRTVLAISEEFYKVTLEASPAADAAASCSTIVSSLQTYDTGPQEFVNKASPVTWSPSNPTTYPSIVVGFGGLQNGYTSMGGPTGISGFTLIMDSRTDSGYSGGGFPTLMTVGYTQLAAGSPGSMDMTFTSNPAESWEGMAIYIPTSATTFVQKGKQVGSGQTVTLGAAPTAGNLLVLCKFAETSDFSPPDPPPGFTRVLYNTFHSSAPGHAAMEICVRCVQAGDTASVNVGNASKSHWASLTEWALT